MLISGIKNNLARLGFSKYEIDFYLALLINGPLTSVEVVKRSGIPHSRIYDVAKRLSEKGLIEIVNSRPRLFKPVDPRVAVQAYIEREKMRLESTGTSLLQHLEKIIGGHRGDFYNTSWVVESKFSELLVPNIREAKHQLMISSYSDMVDGVLDEVLWAASRGVNVTLVLYGVPQGKDRLVSQGVEVYVRKVPSLLMLVVDASASIIGDKNINYSIYSRDPVLVRAFMDLYHDSMVRHSEPIYVPPVLKGRFYSIWSIIHRVRGGERVVVEGRSIKSGRLVRVEGTVKDKVVDDGVATLILETDKGEVRVGGMGARFEDIEAMYFEFPV